MPRFSCERNAMINSGYLTSQSVRNLCSLGLFLAGYIFYSSSLTETFYAAEFSLNSWQIGIAQSAVPLGAILGAIIAGRLADMFGRHRLLVWNFLLLALAGLAGGIIFDFNSLCLMRLLNGLLAGTLYPLCAAYLTEMTPDTSVARQAAVLMFINCLAAPAGCVLAILLSLCCDKYSLWRVLNMMLAIPAFGAWIWSKQLPESTAWLYHEKSRVRVKTWWREALSGLKVLFNDANRRVTFCLMGSWFLMDVAYYGINFFIPYLLQLMQVETLSSGFSEHNLLSSQTIWGTLIINLFFMLGAFGAIFIVERINLIRLQKYGFLYAGLSLFMLALYFYAGFHQAYVVIILFVIFNFALNLGPDVTTYLLSATSYPVAIRGSGHGFSAGFAKFGSFLGVLFLPRLQDAWGYETVIFLLSLLLFAAYLLTIKYSEDKIITEADAAYETN